ncbi:MAG: hypothetical protein LBK27_05510 [Treponema sp.]|nr:hypothetical protein [Treponema sp.]
MKRTICILVIVAVIGLIGCASTGQSAATKIDEDVHLYTLESQSVITLAPYIKILSIDGSDYNGQGTGWGDNIISPGEHTLSVQYNTGSVFSDNMLISFTFEPGKLYDIYYEITGGNNYSRIIGTIKFFIVERDRKKEVKYLAFSETNPHYLEGTWAYSKSYPFEDIEITFNNNRFTTASFNRVSKNKSLTEGLYFFDENTIILYYEKIRGRDDLQKNILYYELKNGILSIKSGGNVAIVTAGGLKGEYNKK